MEHVTGNRVLSSQCGTPAADMLEPLRWTKRVFLFFSLDV